jgi:hypothetical protein
MPISAPLQMKGRRWQSRAERPSNQPIDLAALSDILDCLGVASANFNTIGDGTSSRPVVLLHRRVVAMSRIRSEKVAEILGIGVRCVQKMAVGGRLPSAARIGKLWTFDEVVIRKFLADEEARVACRQTDVRTNPQTTTYTSARMSGGFASLSKERNIEKAYRQAISDALASCVTKRSSSSKKHGPGSKVRPGKRQLQATSHM